MASYEMAATASERGSGEGEQEQELTAMTKECSARSETVRSRRI